MEDKIQYQSEKFELIEAVIKGKQHYYVEGYASTTDEDDAGEIVVNEAQDDLTNQLVGQTITLDIEHEDWIGEDGEILRVPKQKNIPVAKIVEATRKAKGTWVKAELNQDAPRFKNVLGSIKNGFLHSFSIAFWKVDAITKQVGGTVKTFINKLNLNNITLTGNPMNKACSFSMALKSYIKSKEGEQMVNEEQKPVEPEKVEPEKVEKVEPVKVEPEKVETVEPVKNDIEELKLKLEEERKALETEKAELLKQKQDFEAKQTELTASKNDFIAQTAEVASPLSQIKSLHKEIADLKAELNKPVFKSKIANAEESIAFEEKQAQLKSILSYIN